MSYYQGDYYQGDYYQGGLFSSIGKQLKRSFRDIGKIAKVAAPIAALAVPGLGAGLAGKALAIGARFKKARGVVNAASKLRSQLTAPDPMATPAQQLTDLTGRTVGTPVLYESGSSNESMPQAEHARWMAGGAQMDASGWPMIPVRKKRSQGARKAARSKRKAYRRRTTTTRRTRTRKRRKARMRR